MAVIIKTSGEAIKTSPQNGKYFQLKELQEFVGGFIEIAHLGDDAIMVLNEEGKLKGLEYNSVATNLYQSYYGMGDYIVGNVLVCERDLVR